MIGCGKGVIRSVLVDKKNKSEVIPVDYAIHGLIVIPYEFNKHKTRPAEIPVYNITNAEHRKLPIGTIIEMSKRVNEAYPLNAGLWYPDPCLTTNKLYHKFNTILFHWLPAYFIDFLLLCFGQKRFMVRVHQKIATGLEVLQFFTLSPWCFKSDNYAGLWSSLTNKDKEYFNMNMDPVHTEEEYMISCAKGGRLFMMKEKPEHQGRARVHLKIMWLVDRLCKSVIVYFFFYYLLKWTVTPAYKDPMPGWVDSLNGPVGVTIAGARGVLRSMLCDGDLKTDIIPVDLAINNLIVIPYGFNQFKTRPSEIPVYNLTVPENCQRTWKWVMDKGVEVNKKYPLSWPLWYPNSTFTLNKYYHWFNMIFFMWLPALLIDGLLTIFGQRRFMIRVQKRIAVGLDVLQFFTTRVWNFRYDKFSQLRAGLTPQDLEVFEIQSEDRQYDLEDYMLQCCLGGRLYMCKEPISNVPRAKIILNCMYVLDIVCKTLICGWFFYWLAAKIGLVDFVELVFTN